MNKYGRAGRITVENQFMLVSSIQVFEKGEKVIQPILLVPELLREAGLTLQQKKDYRLMKELVKETVMSPEQRLQKIK